MAPAANSATIAKTSPEKCEIEKKRKEKKPVNEIEEIFKAAKKKRKELPPPASSSSAETKANKKSAMKKIKKEPKKEPKKSEDELSSRKRRKTADGLSIYSAKELGIGNPDAGDTPLCPFDCSCCF